MIDFQSFRLLAEDPKKLAYRPIDEGENWYDDNAENRHKVCVALQFDRRAEDLELVRFLFEQEVLRAENDPSQGGGDDLELCAYLLALAKDPKDLPLFLRAKQANFDTECGFSGECLFYCGVEQTKKLLKESELLERYDFSQSDVDSWFEHRHAYFPDDWEAVSLLGRCDVLHELGLTDEAKACLQTWESSLEPTKRKLTAVRMRWKLLGEFRRAAAVLERILELDLEPRERLSELGQLVEMLTSAGDFAGASSALEPYLELLLREESWFRYGFGRLAVERCFVLATKPFPGAAAVFARGQELFELLTVKPLLLLESRASAASAVGKI